MRRRHYRRDGQPMRAAPPTVILAKFAGTCFGCGEAVAAGDRVLYDPSIRRVYATDCPTRCSAARLAEYEAGDARHRGELEDDERNSTMHAM